MTVPEMTQARIVVVDDHSLNVALALKVLSQAGYTDVRGDNDPAKRARTAPLALQRFGV